MRIHHIINQYSLVGGAERLVQVLHRGLRDRGVESFVFGLTAGDEDLAYASSMGLKTPYHWRAFNGIRRYVIENVEDGDIIHAHLFPTNLYLSILKKVGIVKVPLICTEHSTSNRRREKLTGRILDTLTYVGYDRVIAISMGTEQKLLEWKPELNGRTSVVTNGTRLVFTSPTRREEKNFLKILSVGSLRQAKNYESAINAIALLKKFDFEYHIAGIGSDIEHLKQQCKFLGIESKVKFLGHVEDIPSLLLQADIFLMPSLWEGFGLAAVEAMNAGLPVVVSDVAGLREVIEYDPPCALLIDPKSPESIANALRVLLNSYEMRLELGERSFEKAKLFTEDKMIDGYLNVYSEMLKNGS